MVGGFLRDVYLHKTKELTDFDFCVEKDAFKLAKEFSKITHSKLIVLDDEQKSYRVIVKLKDNIYTYDFTQLRGDSLIEDMSLRDFTINTLAVDLNDRDLKIIDLLGAREDLNRGIIRIVNENVLKDDPLRILRAFSFLVNYNFRITKSTEYLLEKYRFLLKDVSGERINEELFKILDCENSFKAIKKMSKLRIIDEIIPYISIQRGVNQGTYHHLDVWGHSLDTLYRWELLYGRRLKKDKDIFEYLNRSVSNKHKVFHIIKLACLLHDIGKPIAKKRKDKKTIFYAHEKIGADMVEEIYQRLKLSGKEKDLLRRLILYHLRPGYLAEQERPSKRAVYRFFRDTEEEGVAVIILSLADWRATRGPLTDSKKRVKHERVMFSLIKNYFQDKKKKPLPKLVDGYEIMRKFKISPSPLVGKILKRIREEQTLGKISSKQEAYSIAEKIIAHEKINKLQ
ncbi:MAG: HD domain-containing protein [Candidatus Omnitrophica bacterium]|nr:HD domain-containing protein [Candidatus Omnitrophota bacterium]